MPANIKVGLVVASLNGDSVLGQSHEEIMKKLQKSPRPLAIQFVDTPAAKPKSAAPTSVQNQCVMR